MKKKMLFVIEQSSIGHHNKSFDKEHNNKYKKIINTRNKNQIIIRKVREESFEAI